jgi:hypothetical protein
MTACALLRGNEPRRMLGLRCICDGLFCRSDRPDKSYHHHALRGFFDIRGRLDPVTSAAHDAVVDHVVGKSIDEYLLHGKRLYERWVSHWNCPGLERSRWFLPTLIPPRNCRNGNRFCNATEMGHFVEGDE